MKKVFIVFLVILTATCVRADEIRCPAKPAPVSPELNRILKRAITFEKKGQSEKSLNLLLSYSQNKKNHYRLAFQTGMIYYNLNNLDSASVFFRKSIDLNPCFSQARQNLAVVRHEQGNDAEAAELMEQAYRLEKSSNPDLLFQAAVFHLKAGNPALALPHLQKLANRKKADPQWLTALVNAQVKLGRLDKARKKLDKLIGMQPGRVDLWKLAAWISLAGKDYVAAAAALEIAFRLKPPEKKEMKQIGDIYISAGAPLQAAQYYKKSFGDNPGPDELVLLARTYMQARQIDSALEYAQKAVKIKEDEPNLALLGDIYLAKRDYPAAYKNYLQTSKTGGNKSGLYYYKAGYTALKADMLDEAENAFNNCLAEGAPAANPHAEAAKALESIRAAKKFIAETEGRPTD